MIVLSKKKLLICLLIISLIGCAIAEEPINVESEMVVIKPIEEPIVEEEKPFELPDDNHWVELDVIKDPHYIGDNAILELKLINYAPGEILKVEWEWTLDEETWYTIPDANELIYDFIVTEENVLYIYHGVVTYKYYTGD